MAGAATRGGVPIEGARAVMTMAGTSAVVIDSALEQFAHGVHQQANEADSGGEKGNPLAS